MRDISNFDIHTEYDKLSYAACVDSLKMSYLDDIQLFLEEAEGHADLPDVLIKAKGLMSLIYAINGHVDQSLDIDLELMYSCGSDFLIKSYPRICWAVKSASELNRQDEVRPFALRYILNEKVDHWGSLLIVLDWYIKNYPDDQKIPRDFELVFSRICGALEYDYDQNIPLENRVNILLGVFRSSSKNLEQFTREIHKSPDVNNDTILAAYLSTEPLSIFRGYAIDIRLNHK